MSLPTSVGLVGAEPERDVLLAAHRHDGDLCASLPQDDSGARGAAYAKAYAAATLAGELAELVYTLRTRAGLTQTQLARRMGPTQSSVARIEGGGSLPTVDLLARLSRATGAELRIIAPGIADVALDRVA